jgi:hypothetical protein
MNDTSVDQSGRSRMEHEPGQLDVAFVTLALLSEPVLRFVQINRRFLAGELLVACVVLIIALVLAYVLWTGTPQRGLGR